MSRVIRSYQDMQITVEDINKEKDTLIGNLELADATCHVVVSALEEESGVIFALMRDNVELTSGIVEEEQFCDAWYDCRLRNYTMSEAVLSKDTDFPAVTFLRLILHKLLLKVTEQQGQTIEIPDTDLMIV